MRDIENLQAFCKGYLEGALACNANLLEWDDWVLWSEYDINFVGQDYTSEELGNGALLAVVYPRGWEGNLPDHLHCFKVQGEQQ